MNHAIHSDLAHAMIIGIGDIQIARRVDPNPVRRIHRRGSRGYTIGIEALFAIADHGGNDPAEVDLADQPCRSVADINVAGGIESDAYRTGKLRRACASVITDGAPS